MSLTTIAEKYPAIKVDKDNAKTVETHKGTPKTTRNPHEDTAGALNRNRSSSFRVARMDCKDDRKAVIWETLKGHDGPEAFYLDFGQTTDSFRMLGPSTKKLSVELPNVHPAYDIAVVALIFGPKFKWMRRITSAEKSNSCSFAAGIGVGEKNRRVYGLEIDPVKIPPDIHYIMCFAKTSVINVVTSVEIEPPSVKICYGKAGMKRTLLSEFPVTELSPLLKPVACLTRQGAKWGFQQLELPPDHSAITETFMKPSPFQKQEHSIHCTINSTTHLQTLFHVESIPTKRRRIKIRVTHGRELAPKDDALFTGERTSDPYFVIRYKNLLFQSRHRPKTLNPRWEEEPVDLGLVAENETSSITITVMDYDFISNDDYMGSVESSILCFYHLGVGENLLEAKLDASKDYKDDEVSGLVFFTVTVENETCL